MAIRAWYDVWCDDEDCNEWTTGGSTKQVAEVNALNNGWTKQRGKGWRCPDHQTLPKQETK